MKRHHHLFVVLLFVLAACDSSTPATIPPPTLPPINTPQATTTAPPTIPPNTPLSSSPTAVVALPTTKPTAPPAATATPVRQGFNMRAVDWFKLVTTDPNLTYDSSIQPPPGLKRAPWVQLRSNNYIQGHALIEPEQILFMDMSGDGQDEAIISIFSGGTAGNLGLLIYTVANNAPILADSIPGYKLGGVADGKFLKVIDPIYQGWEPNCCPSGFFETRYRLQANKLVQVSRDEKPIPEARKLTVEKFYELLAAKNYADAYNNFLGPAYRASHAYQSWSAGYANTVSFTVQTADLPDGRVKVDLTATDKTASGNVTKKFTGTWKLIWYSTARFKQWVLDAGNFVEVK